MADQAENLFNQEDKQNAPTGEPQKEPQQKGMEDLLSQIVDAQGAQKYATVDKALESLNASQEHIRTLEEENRKLREQTATSKGVEEVLAAIQTKQEAEAQPAGSGVGEEEVGLEDKVLQILQASEQKKKAEANIALVVQRSTEVFGEKASEAFYEKAAAVGLSVDQINSLAAASPTAVFELLSLDKTPAQEPGRSSSINTEAGNFQQNAPTQEKKSINRIGTTTKDLVNEWRAAGEEAKAK
jgi:hypothetical protein